MMKRQRFVENEDSELFIFVIESAFLCKTTPRGKNQCSNSIRINPTTGVFGEKPRKARDPMMY